MEAKTYDEFMASLPQYAARRNAWLRRLGKRKMRMAVLLTGPYGFGTGTMRLICDICEMILKGSQATGEAWEVVAGFLETGPYDFITDFGKLRNLGVKVRPYSLEMRPADEGRPFFNQADYGFENFCQFKDGGEDFLDCDFWLLLPGISAPIIPWRPYSVWITDLLSRYCIEGGLAGFHDYFPAASFTLRKAAFFVATTKSTLDDAIMFFGLPRPKGWLVEAGLIYHRKPAEKPLPGLETGRYFLCVTNTTEHKNLPRLFKAAITYYANGGELGLAFCGGSTELLDPGRQHTGPLANHPGLATLRETVAASPALLKHLHFLGILSDDDYITAIKYAACVICPTIYDNGCGAVLDASFQGVPAIMGDHPSQHEWDERFGINARYVDPYDVEALTLAMLEMQQPPPKYHPSRIELTKRASFTLESQAPPFFKEFSRRVYEALEISQGGHND